MGSCISPERTGISPEPPPQEFPIKVLTEHVGPEGTTAHSGIPAGCVLSHSIQSYKKESIRVPHQL